MEAGECPVEAVPELQAVIDTIKTVYPDFGEKARKEKGYAGFGSTIFAVKPGDGSAREQAASCQKVLGGWANIANEYATKRYRSNLINWGMLPFIIGKGDLPFENLDYLFHCVSLDFRLLVLNSFSDLRNKEIIQIFKWKITLPDNEYASMTPKINAVSTLLFLFVLVLLIVTNVRQSRDEKRREAARREGALS